MIVLVASALPVDFNTRKCGIGNVCSGFHVGDGLGNAKIAPGQITFDREFTVLISNTREGVKYVCVTWRILSIFLILLYILPK